MSGFTGINTDYVVSYRKPTDTKNVSQCHGSLDLRYILELLMIDKTTITCAFETQQKRDAFIMRYLGKINVEVETIYL